MISSISWSLCRYLSCTTPQHPPPGFFHLAHRPGTYCGHQFLAQQWHSRAGFQLPKAQPCLATVPGAWSRSGQPTNPSPSLSPALDGGVQCPRLELGRGEDETQWSMSSLEPCPGMGGTRNLVTASTNLQIMPDQLNWLLQRDKWLCGWGETNRDLSKAKRARYNQDVWTCECIENYLDGQPQMFLFSAVKPKGHPVSSGVNAENGQYVLTFSLVTWVMELNVPSTRLGIWEEQLLFW